MFCENPAGKGCSEPGLSFPAGHGSAEPEGRGGEAGKLAELKIHAGDFGRPGAWFDRLTIHNPS